MPGLVLQDLTDYGEAFGLDSQSFDFLTEVTGSGIWNHHSSSYMLNGLGGEQGCKRKTEETPLMPTVCDGSGAHSDSIQALLYSLVRQPGLLLPACFALKVLDSLLG